MQSARVTPDDISYAEMHGTGTQIGDPAEMNAVASIFKHRHGNNPLTVGGVKANVGHSEAVSNIYLELAAGMASLLKCIMMFQVSQLFGTKLQSWNNLCILTPSFGEQKGIMPPQAGMPHALNLRYPSLSELNIEILSEPKEFKPVDQRPRRILRNNFNAAVRSHL